MSQKLTITASQAGQRLDIFCAGKFPDHSRVSLQRAIKAGSITVNGLQVKPRYETREGDKVTTERIWSEAVSRAEPRIDATRLVLGILFEDKDVVVVNKPAGLIVHPVTEQDNQPSVAAWFTRHYPDSAGYVHRLDKDTTGALILAKNKTAYDHLRAQFKKHRVKKEYLALVYGVPNATDGRINQPLTRSKKNPSRRTTLPKKVLSKDKAVTYRGAITEWATAQKLNDHFTLLRIFPLTGRTHQIRVHLHHIGHPVVGDSLYVFKRQKPPVGVTHQLLHAERITFQLPSREKKTIVAPLPQDFEQIITKLHE